MCSHRSISSSFGLAIAVSLIALGASAQQPGPRAIRDALRAHPTAAEADALEAALTTAGFHVERSPLHHPDGTETPHFALALAQPVRATSASRDLGLRRPCAFSPDVHQTTWIVESCRPHEGDLRAATPLTIGAWTVRLRLAGRPSGPLPSTRVGPSPAYTLGASQVVSIEISIREP